jgi:hypothetical protein
VSAIALVGPLDGFVIQRQNPDSIATFGGLVGRGWMTLSPPEVATVGYRAIEETLDTGRMVRFELESEHGWGQSSALALRTGQVMTSWRPIIGPSRGHDLESFCRQAADHLDRLATALEQGLPLPHFPSAPRPDPRPVPGSPPAAR